MCQFLHLGTYGREPKKGALRWSCIVGVCAETARLPQACGHLPYRAEPNVLHGVSPVEAGRIAVGDEVVMSRPGALTPDET